MTNVYDAKAKLSELINQSLAGHDVYISKAGVPMVKIVPVDSMPIKRMPGSWKGKVKIAKNFATLPKHILNAFEGTP